MDSVAQMNIDIAARAEIERRICEAAEIVDIISLPAQLLVLPLLMSPLYLHQSPRAVGLTVLRLGALGMVMV